MILQQLRLWDIQTCTRANQWAWRLWLRNYFVLVSRLGDRWAWYLLIAGVAVSGHPYALQAALHLSAVALVSLLLYTSMKRYTRRPRPYVKHPHIVAWTAPLDEFSFPSGHTLHAISMSCIAMHYFPWLGIILVPLSISIALSRIVLGVHYPSDVIAAGLIGLSMASTSIWLFGA
jgi:undecaprenyl-diphosphatase